MKKKKSLSFTGTYIKFCKVEGEVFSLRRVKVQTANGVRLEARRVRRGL